MKDMGYKPRHAFRRALDRLSWPARIVGGGVIAGSMTLLGATVLPSAGSAATAPICTGHCSWEQLGQPSGYVLDVKGQVAQPGTAIIAWKGEAGNPSEDFTVTVAPSLPVTLSANDDSTAVWDSAGNIVLTAGTHSGTSAQMRVQNINDTQAPDTAPSFTASNQQAGNPRWVLEFHNGQILDGNGTGATAWSCPFSSVSSTTYADALAACQAGGSDDSLTAAFIVMDAGNPNTPETLTGVQYNGLSPTQAPLYEIVYTPYTNLTGAGMAANSSNPATHAAGTEATNAYSSSANGGKPLYCVGVGAMSGDQSALASCGQPGTIFHGVIGLSNHTLFELAANHGLSLNDRAFGGNGSPIIAYATNTGSWNEEFWPGIHNAAS